MQRPVTPQQRTFAGTAALLAGSGILALGAGLFPDALRGLHAPLWVVLAAGSIFSLSGILILLQERAPQWLSGLILCMLLSLFAAIPAWIAWGGGRREFDGSLAMLASMFEFDTGNIGRFVFGAGALAMAAGAAFAWLYWLRRLPWPARLALLPVLAAGGYAIFVVLPAEPRWPEVHDDHERLSRYALLSDRDGLAARAGSEPASWYDPPWRSLEQWTKAARSRLAAARSAPPDQAVLAIPASPHAPVIDGRIDAGEWSGALRIRLAPEALGTSVLMTSDGRFLYLAADVPADTTETGFDQFRFWFHIGLSPSLDNERAFVDRSGSVTALRTVQVPQEGRKSKPRTDWRIYERALGGTSVIGHRRFELALDMAESGIKPGVPFAAWVEVEGDPVRDAAGKFRARTNLGQAGDRRTPLWLRIAAAP